MANRIAYFRKRAGLTQQRLGELLNSGRSTVVKLERGERPLTTHWLDRLSKELNCSPTDILGDEVAIVGKIGAGGTIIYEDVGNNDTIKRPPETPGELVGLEVAGESMLPKFDPGDVIFISREHDGVDLRDIGAYCAVRLRSGETFLKKLARGSRPGLFTLRSLNADDIEDCELEWATPVRASIPKFARRFS
jgi:repressor LexA